MKIHKPTITDYTEAQHTHESSDQGGVIQGAGYSGFSGYSGAVGASGISGATSESGYSGIVGTSGYSGISGASGASGYSGISGAVGSSGYSGVGASGYSGAIGISGYSGIVGTSGYSGISGAAGSSGYSGISGAGGSVVRELVFCVPGALAAGDQAPWIHVPWAGTINSAIAVVKTSSTSGAITIDILLCTDPTAGTPTWTSIFSTKITIDVNERSTESAAIPAVLGVTTFGVDDYFRINIDGAGTGAADLTVGMKVTV